jgi:hypothetical protein
LRQKAEGRTGHRIAAVGVLQRDGVVVRADAVLLEALVDGGATE